MYAQSLAYYLLHDKHLINVVNIIASCYSSHSSWTQKFWFQVHDSIWKSY